MIRGKDTSNYTENLTAAIIDAWVAQDFRLALVQALTPPPGKPHAGDGGNCLRQIEIAQAGGMATDSYLFWQDGLAETFRQRIALMGGVSIRQWWVDLEVMVAGLAGQALTDSVHEAFLAADAAPALLSRLSGAYTGQYWINWYVKQGGDLAVLDGRPKWMANFNGIADVSDTLYGGQPVQIKQYAGTQADGTDLNVLSEAEAALLFPAPIDMTEELINALAYCTDTIGDQFLEVRDAPVSLAPGLLLTLQVELQRVRGQFIGPRY